MPNLLTIPNELLDEIVSYLDPLDTSNLLISCRCLSSLLTPTMHLHACAPKGNVPALHWASKKGHLPLVQYLLTRFPVDLPNRGGATALQSAAWACRNILVLEYLLLHGAVVNHVDYRGATALHYGCQGIIKTDDTAEATVRLLIAHGADVNGEVPFIPLETALDANFPRVVRLLLDAGANPNVRSSTDEPLVVVAARRAQTKVILGLLLDYGADIDASNRHASNALLIAAQYGPLATVQMLVDRGAKMDCEDHDADTPLILAIKSQRLDIAEYLVGREDVDIRSANLAGDTPVGLVLSVGYDTVLRVLLQRGASIHDANTGERLALHSAVARGWHDVVHTLLENGANIETEDIMGATALMLAIIRQDVPMAMALLDHGADPNHGSSEGLPLTAACMGGLETVVGVLLEKCVDVNRVGEDGLTAMAHARNMGNSSLVGMLAAYGGVGRDGE